MSGLRRGLGLSYSYNAITQTECKLAPKISSQSKFQRPHKLDFCLLGFVHKVSRQRKEEHTCNWEIERVATSEFLLIWGPYTPPRSSEAVENRTMKQRMKMTSLLRLNEIAFSNSTNDPKKKVHYLALRGSSTPYHLCSFFSCFFEFEFGLFVFQGLGLPLSL